MNLSRKITIAFLSLIICPFAYAQRDSVKVRVFSGTEPTTPVVRHYEDKNYLRFNPYLIARGAFTVGIERILHDKHSVSIDLGLTYRDFLYEIFNEEADLFDTEGVEIKIGKYFDVAYKFYPSDYGEFDEAFYISPGFIYRNYNVITSVAYYNGNRDMTVNVDTGYNMSEMYLKFGFLHESWIFDNLITDTYFGVGYRTTNKNTYETVDQPNGGYLVKTGTTTKSLPCIYLGLRLGFSW